MAEEIVTMTDAELGKLAGSALDDEGFEDALIALVREAVETALTKVSADKATHRRGRAAGERLGKALVTDRRARRAEAFRAMAGVGLSAPRDRS
jgi:hypothetical protein